MKQFFVRFFAVCVIIIGLAGLFADTSLSWVILPEVKPEDRDKFKQATAKDKVPCYRCPSCQTFITSADTKSDNAICPKCSKEVPDGNDFIQFSCSNCGKINTVKNAKAIVMCTKCSFLIIDLLY